MLGDWCTFRLSKHRYVIPYKLTCPVIIFPVVVDHVLEKDSRMHSSLGVFLRIVNLVFDVKGARQPCLTSHHDSTRYVLAELPSKLEMPTPWATTEISPTILRDIIKGHQVANPMLHGMVLPLLLSGKVTNQNNNQNITKPTTPNR